MQSIIKKFLYYISKTDALASQFDSNGNETKHFKDGIHKQSCQHCGANFIDTIGEKGHSLYPIKFCSSQCNQEVCNIRLAERRKVYNERKNIKK